MPGPISINKDVIKPLENIAFKDNQGNWRAGPDAKGYKPGQFVDTTYAKQARSQRQRTNLVKANMRRQDMDEDNARDFINEKQEELKREKQKEEPDRERITEIRKSMRGS